jgi:asparagine N-glycosylation enzyme membrane subunit Stt3
MVREGILPLSSKARGILALIILFAVPTAITIAYAMHDKLGLHFAPEKLYFYSASFFISIIFIIFASASVAANNKDNPGLFIFSFSTMMFSIVSAIGVAIYLSVQYIEFATIFAVLLTIASAIALLDEEIL